MLFFFAPAPPPPPATPLHVAKHIVETILHFVGVTSQNMHVATAMSVVLTKFCNSVGTLIGYLLKTSNHNETERLVKFYPNKTIYVHSAGNSYTIWIHAVYIIMAQHTLI